MKNSIQEWRKQPFHFYILHNTESALEKPISQNITYLHLPGLSFSDRAKKACEVLKSPFSLLLSDDDRIITSGVMEMIKTMSRDASVYSVSAKAMGAFKFSRNMTSVANAYEHMNHYSNSENSSMRRLEHHFNRRDLRGTPIGTMYRVMRKDLMLSMLSAFGNFNSLSSPYVFEAAAETIVTAQGKSQFVDRYYWIRNWETKIISHSNWNRDNTFAKWWGDSRLHSEHEIFLNTLSEASSLNRQAIEFFIQLYVNSMQKNLPHTKTKNKATLRKLRKLKRFYVSHFSPERIPNELSVFLEESMKTSPLEELHEIEQLIKQMLS